VTALHGGPDALGVPRWDFSTNANACGPCPMALEAVRSADPRHYPDPSYTELRASLAAHHGVHPNRIVLAGSASEFISRISAAVAHGGDVRRVWLPALAYGDYGRAARAWGLERVANPQLADLLWLCEPSSPRGGAEAEAARVVEGASTVDGAVVVLDRAYEPLRLAGACSLNAEALDSVWQLWSPNKALAMTGVRGAYAIAPVHSEALADQLNAMAPSWPLGAHAVAMLMAWGRADVQDWLAGCKQQLTVWKAKQVSLLTLQNWHCLSSEANYFCARPPEAVDAQALRDQGIKLRETTSLGLEGHWRLSVQPPQAQAALVAGLAACSVKQERRI
jgi:histidinol-phosphate aminotransferase